MSRCAARFAALLCLTVAAVATARAQPLGSEFQVNVYTTGIQGSSLVALDDDGDFVVVWVSVDQDGDEVGVFARRFSPVGIALGAEFQVNTYTMGDQLRPSAARDADGDFVVVWDSEGQDGSGGGIFARRFAANGSPLGVEFQVNTYTPGNHFNAAVTAEGDGDFVAAWTASGQDGSLSGVFARRYDSTGQPQAVEFQVNVYTTESQTRPGVAVDADGNLIVAWTSEGQDGSTSGVFARRFDSAGSALAFEFQVNVYTTSDQWFPAVGTDDSGGFVVVWESTDQDGDLEGVFGRRFSVVGLPLGSEFQINTHTESYQYLPRVAVRGNGEFVVVWSSLNQDGSNYGVFGRHFDSTGSPPGSEFQVTTYTLGGQYRGTVGMDASGDFVIAWTTEGQDGSSTGVFAQRFGTLAVLDIDANGSTGALTDGLLVLRYLFGFTGATLVSGAVDTGACTRCTAKEIETYLETLI
jgi:hypothetical protein